MADGSAGESGVDFDSGWIDDAVGAGNRDEVRGRMGGMRDWRK